MDVSPRGLRAFRNPRASRRQQSDLVTLAHIKEQPRLSLGSCAPPWMTEELKGISLEVGHRPCCTNPVGNSLREASMIAGRHEQLAPTKYKTTNWSPYNDSLRPPGSLAIR